MIDTMRELSLARLARIDPRAVGAGAASASAQAQIHLGGGPGAGRIGACAEPPWSNAARGLLKSYGLRLPRRGLAGRMAQTHRMCEENELRGFDGKVGWRTKIVSVAGRAQQTIGRSAPVVEVVMLMLANPARGA